MERFHQDPSRGRLSLYHLRFFLEGDSNRHQIKDHHDSLVTGVCPYQVENVRSILIYTPPYTFNFFTAAPRDVASFPDLIFCLYAPVFFYLVGSMLHLKKQLRPRPQSTSLCRRMKLMISSTTLSRMPSAIKPSASYPPRPKCNLGKSLMSRSLSKPVEHPAPPVHQKLPA